MRMEDLKYTIDGLKQAVDSYFYHDFVYFWKHDEAGTKVSKACLSQWYPSRFMENGVVYCCAEQYMMAEKARVFNDEVTLSQILQASDPSIIKKLGRLIKNFDSTVWDEKCVEIVYKGNLHKFGQNLMLREFLLATDGATLVEASPYDSIWGIGMTEDEAKKLYPHVWKGENRLGFILMEVRDVFKNRLM